MTVHTPGADALVVADLVWHPLVPTGAGNRQRILALAAHSPAVRAGLIGPGPFPVGLQPPPTRVAPWKPPRCLRGFNPDILGFLYPAALGRMAKAAGAMGPDLVLAEGLWAVPAAARASRLMGRPLAITVNNIEHVVLRHRRKRASAAVVRIIEGQLYARADLLISMSAEDSRRLMCMLGRRCPRVEVIPNGVDPPPRSGRAELPHPNVLFLGKTDYPPNAQAIEELAECWLPAALKSGLPLTAVAVGGPHAPGRQGALVFSGYVDDVWPWIEAADVCVAPLTSGSGTRLKVLAYLAAGKPVIATALAVEGLGLVPEVHYLRAETGEEFAEALKRLRRSPDLAAALSLRGKELSARFSWEAIAERWAQVLRSAAMGQGRSDNLARNER